MDMGVFFLNSCCLFSISADLDLPSCAAEYNRIRPSLSHTCTTATGFDIHNKAITSSNALFECSGMSFCLMFLTCFSCSCFAVDLAPVASSLCVKYTHRAVVITGGLLAFSGMALGCLGLNMIWMYATTGFLQGTTLWLYGFLALETQNPYSRMLMAGVLKSDFYFYFKNI